MRTYLSIEELERKGLFQTVGASEETRVYELVQNKGMRYLGRPSLKQTFDSPTINICGDTFDVSQTKANAYLAVEVTILP